MPARKLNFKMQKQLKDNWCWAANAASISKYYISSSTWTQCKVAATCLGFPECCTAPTPYYCDVPHYLNKALMATSNFDRWTGNSLDFSSILSEIDEKRVIGVRIEWPDKSGHFLAVFGYDDTSGTEFIYVADPIYDEAFVNLANFTSKYKGKGRWTDTYFTKSPVGTMLRFATISKNFLEKARSISPSAVLSDQERFKHSPRRAISIAMPHELYLIDFMALKSDGILKLTKGGIRLLDEGSEGSKVIYEFDGEGGDAQLQQVLYGKQFVSKYTEILSNIEREQAANPLAYDLRVVQQPELKVEAIWLHSDKHDVKDELFPLIKNDFLETDKSYKFEDFVSKLTQSARNKMLSEDRKLGGM